MPHVNKQMISFFLTTKCNLRCTYCYNCVERASKEEQTIPLAFAKLGIDNFFANNDSRHIRFYGPGEPSQEFERLKEIRDYAYSIAGDKLSVEIQTNGAFSESVCTWIADNIDIVWVSFDGPPDIQDTNRPFPNQQPSSPVIERNVRYLIKNKSKGIVGVRITMDENNIDRQIEMINYFTSLGVNYMWTDPLFPAVEKEPVCHTPGKSDKFFFDMDRFVDKYIEAYSYAKANGVFYGCFLMCNFDGKSIYNCRACTPTPHLTPDGYISACDMVTFGSDAHHMDVFIYGKWNADTNALEFDEEKIKVLQSRSVTNMPGCVECDVAEHCGGYCLGEVVNETGSLFGKKERNCIAIQKIAKAIGFFDSPFQYMHP